jgi:glycerol kinase
MAANPYFCRFLADVLGRTVMVRALPELTALGAALLAGADQPAGGEDRTFEPRPIDPAPMRARFAEAVGRARGWRSA